jgi:hypothetical protein
MSVINNVLKNLESRESRFTPIELNAVVSDAAPVRDLKPLLLITTLFVLLAVARCPAAHTGKCCARNARVGPAVCC